MIHGKQGVWLHPATPPAGRLGFCPSISEPEHSWGYHQSESCSETSFSKKYRVGKESCLEHLLASQAQD